MNVNGNAVTPSPNYIDTSDLSDARHYKSAKYDCLHHPRRQYRQTDIGITFLCTGTVRLARLDNITVNHIHVRSLARWSPTGVPHRPWVCPRCQWQYPHMGYITSPGAVARVDFTVDGGKVCSTPTSSGVWGHVAWNADAESPTPAYVGTTANQNLHGEGDTRHGHIHIAAMEGKEPSNWPTYTARLRRTSRYWW